MGYCKYILIWFMMVTGHLLAWIHKLAVQHFRNWGLKSIHKSYKIHICFPKTGEEIISTNPIDTDVHVSATKLKNRAVVDLRGALPARAPYDPKFSQFHTVFWKILAKIVGWCPLLRGILDPPLDRIWLCCNDTWHSDLKRTIRQKGSSKSATLTYTITK